MKTHSISILAFIMLAFACTAHAQWTLVTSDLPYNSDAAYATDQIAFLVGYSVSSIPEIDGHIYKSTDGGLTFSEVLSTVNAEYTAVHFVNEQLGFVGGDHQFNGVILRTTDGGANWETTLVNEYVPMFEEFYFITDTVGFVVGGYGKDLIFKTEDGGGTWENISFSDGPSLSNISFVDDSVGFVSSIFGDIYKTIDQGESWTIHPNLPPVDQIYDMHFINENTGLVTDNDGLILRTQNAGGDWTEIHLPGVDTIDRVHFHFVSDTSGFITTYADDQRKLFRTLNSGEIWSEIFYVEGPAFWTFMAFSPTNTNVLLGGSNSLYVNTNAEWIITSSEIITKELSEFTLSPNPAKDDIDVSLTFANNIPFQINLIDVVGRVYESRQFTGKEVNTKFTINTLAEGMYYIQIATEKGVAVKSFVKY